MNEQLDSLFDDLRSLLTNATTIATDAVVDILDESKDTLSTVMITLSNNGHAELSEAVGKALTLNYRALEVLQDR